MSSYLTDKYAGMLTEEDVTLLFNLLAKEFGDNRSEAARRCGLTGKATYDWENAAYVKLGTKKKVLEASLKGNFLRTVEYLLRRSTDSSQDLLRTILATLYSNALESLSPEDFKSAYTKFEQIRKRHVGMIRDEIQVEVTDMAVALREKAGDLNIIIEPKSLNEFSTEELLNSIKIIGQIYSENPQQAEEFAQKEIGLPIGALKPIIGTFKNLCLIRKIQTNTLDGASEKVKQLTTPTSIFTAENAPWLNNLSYISPISHDDLWDKLMSGKQVEGGKLGEITTRS